MAKKMAIDTTKKEEVKEKVEITTYTRKPRQGKAPIYIGLMAEADNKFKDKLKSLFLESLDKMAHDLPEHAALFNKMMNVCTEMMK